MKRTVLLVSFLVVIALSAHAQTFIQFGGMHWVSIPTQMPDNYPPGTNLSWDNFLYVTPGLWNGAGPGFWVDPATPHNIVAFTGGPYCNIAASCGGSIKLMPSAETSTGRGFQPISMSLPAGWQQNGVIVTAYNNSKFLGSTEWQVTTKPTLFKFPVAWPNVTQLVFTPRFNTSSTKPPAGSMVIYSFLLVEH
ncbi:MAG TPA: hypothetical protein VGG15_07355 [Terriglobales bacterium]|jgi:hypothetical protein